MAQRSLLEAEDGALELKACSFDLSKISKREIQFGKILDVS